MATRSLVLYLALYVFVDLTSADLGFISMGRVFQNSSVEVCSQFNPRFAPYPTNGNTKGTLVLDIYPDNGCDVPFDSKLYSGKIVIMRRHRNCTFAARARHVQNAKGKGIIVVSNESISTPGGNETDYEEINISVSLITKFSYKLFRNMIAEMGIDNVVVKFYAPASPYWDPNALIMWFLAVFTCSLGGWSQGSVYASEVAARVQRLSEDKEGTKNKNGSKNDATIGVVQALIFFAMCSVSILLMYFFYDYIVYAVIGIFCLASCHATQDFFANIFETSPCFTRRRLPENKIPFLRSRPAVLSIVLFFCCAGFSIFWAINRKESYAWILQDILGFMFCIHMIKQIRLPNYKVSSVLLILFFLYDIFYVFVTPLLTPNRESIMVNIATGGGGKSSEELPMLFKLPRFGYSPYAKCGPLPYSLLGFGDIILPGLHVGFCAVWDFRVSNTVRGHAYFIAAVVGYAAGLILTFIGMYLMMTGQPALLYLAPSCLLSTLIVALKRKELNAVWTGKLSNKATVPQSGRREEDSLLENSI